MEKIVLNKKQKSVKGKLSIVVYKEVKNIIYYCPSLEIVGAGKSDDEAKSSFSTTLEEFLRYTISKKTLHTELKKLGWKINGKKIQEPPMHEMLLKNRDLSTIVNKKEYKKYNEEVELPL